LTVVLADVGSSGLDGAAKSAVINQINSRKDISLMWKGRIPINGENHEYYNSTQRAMDTKDAVF